MKLGNSNDEFGKSLRLDEDTILLEISKHELLVLGAAIWAMREDGNDAYFRFFPDGTDLIELDQFEETSDQIRSDLEILGVDLG